MAWLKRRRHPGCGGCPQCTGDRPDNWQLSQTRISGWWKLQRVTRRRRWWLWRR